MTIQHFPENKISDVLNNRSFPADILNTSGKVAILMTQSWCPQYPMIMKQLQKAEFLEKNDDVSLFIIEYDGKPYYDSFMQFKEDVLGNALIPYLQYFQDGNLIGETNYVSADVFFAQWKA